MSWEEEKGACHGSGELPFQKNQSPFNRVWLESEITCSLFVTGNLSIKSQLLDIKVPDFKGLWNQYHLSACINKISVCEILVHVFSFQHWFLPTNRRRIGTPIQELRASSCERPACPLHITLLAKASPWGGFLSSRQAVRAVLWLGWCPCLSSPAVCGPTTKTNSKSWKDWQQTHSTQVPKGRKSDLLFRSFTKHSRARGTTKLIPKSTDTLWGQPK